MSVCTTSPHFSDVRHFALNNPACENNNNNNSNSDNNNNNNNNNSSS